jgi:hypothetical protein
MLIEEIGVGGKCISAGTRWSGSCLGGKFDDASTRCVWVGWAFHQGLADAETGTKVLPDRPANTRLASGDKTAR